MGLSQVVMTSEDAAAFQAFKASKAARRTSQGVQYVVPGDPGRPKLRAIRQPIHDSEIIGTALADVTLFNNKATFNTGAVKGPSDTNMLDNGKLGTPNEFDLIGFQFELERPNAIEAAGLIFYDKNRIYNRGSFSWLFGNIPWLTNVKLTKVPEGIGQVGSIADSGVAGMPYITSNGVGANVNFLNFTTPDK